MIQTPSPIRPLAALAVLVLLCGCGGSDRAATGVTVSIAPQAWLVNRLAGPGLEVVTALAPGESPASFDPTPRRLAALSGTGLYLATGVPMERVLLPHLRETLPGLTIVDLSAGLDRIAMEGHVHAGHEHEGHAHVHDVDPHVWLSPRLMARMAETAAEALAAHRPDLADAIRANLDGVLAELAALDADLMEILAPAAGRTMLVYHPAFGYLARDHGFEQSAVEKDGLPPSPRHLAEMLAGMCDRGVGTIFVQPQSAGGPVRSLAETEDLEVTVLDPLAADYPDNLRRMARSIAAALAPAGSAAP